MFSGPVPTPTIILKAPEVSVAPKYPNAQEGTTLEVVEVFSAPPSNRFTRRTLGVFDGRACIAWIGDVMRHYPAEGKDRPTKVVFVKALRPTRTYRDGCNDEDVEEFAMPSKRERMRNLRREITARTGGVCTLAAFIADVERYENGN